MKFILTPRTEPLQVNLEQIIPVQNYKESLYAIAIDNDLFACLLLHTSTGSVARNCARLCANLFATTLASVGTLRARGQ